MQIDNYAQIIKLSEGTLLRDPSGDTWNVTHRDSSHTWLEHFSDEYGIWIESDGIPHGNGSNKLLPLTVVHTVDQLTDDERRYLAMHARYAASNEADPRYADPDPSKRQRKHDRWMQIANALHTDPWGETDG